MNLLIVDDEIVTTEVLEHQLDRELLGIDQIYVAYNAAMARKVLEDPQTQVDIVLCDIEMPQENGVHLLEWVRERSMETEFLFLTSHEKFEYAYGAMQYGAAKYLLKPIDMEEIHQALLQVTEKIRRERRMTSIQDYWSYGRRRMVRYFWTRLLTNPGMGAQEIREELERLGIAENVQETYSLALLRFDRSILGLAAEDRQVHQFVVENVLAEALTDEIRMECVVCWERETSFYAGVLSDYEPEEARTRLEQVVPVLERYFAGGFQVGYLSERVAYQEMGRVRAEMEAYDRQHLYDEGEIWRYSTILQREEQQESLLDSKYLRLLLGKGERVKTLDYLHKVLAGVKRSAHSVRGLRYYQLELIQIVSDYLREQGQSMEEIVREPAYLRLDEAATSSEFAMVQWNIYLINHVFELRGRQEAAVDPSVDERSLIERIVDDIRHHYSEDINRNVLAQRYHFTPDYIGKLFNKEMGMSLNDYINSVRIERARHLLENTDYKVVDIAAEVGYDNMPYFSAVFKKYVGVSPAAYRKAQAR